MSLEIIDTFSLQGTGGTPFAFPDLAAGTTVVFVGKFGLSSYDYDSISDPVGFAQWPPDASDLGGTAPDLSVFHVTADVTNILAVTGIGSAGVHPFVAAMIRSQSFIINWSALVDNGGGAGHSPLEGPCPAIAWGTPNTNARVLRLATGPAGTSWASATEVVGLDGSGFAGPPVRVSIGDGGIESVSAPAESFGGDTSISATVGAVDYGIVLPPDHQDTFPAPVGASKLPVTGV